MSATGAENPDAQRNQIMPARIWIMVAAVALGLLVGFGNGHFIPDPDLVRADPVAAGALAFAAVIYLFQVFGKKGDNSLKAYAVLFLSIIAIVFFALYYGSQAFMIGLPDAYTSRYGEPAARQVTALAWLPASHSRRNSICAGVTIAEIPSLIGRLCLNRQVAPGTVLTVHGRQSALGFHVDTIE